MTVPIVHSNGTSKEELLDQITKACYAIGQAIDAVNDAQPNQRDYYPLPSEAWSQAQADHIARLRLLTQLRKEYFNLAIAIDTQG